MITMSANRKKIVDQKEERHGASLGYRCRSAIATAIALVLLTFAPHAGQAEHISVTVDSTDATPGSHVPVRILMENDFPVTSIIVPLIYSAGSLFPDSVTFRGSVVNPDQISTATYCYDSSLVRILVLPTITEPIPMIYDPGGLLATVWFSVSPFAKDGFTELDTAYVFDSLCFGPRRYYYNPEELQASDLLGTQLYPEFIPGGVTVRSDD